MSLAQHEIAKRDIQKEIEAENARHKNVMDILNHRQNQTAEAIQVCLAGLNEEAISRAESLMEIRGKIANSGQDGAKQLESAVQDVLLGAPRMRREYYGTKDYDRWHGQASDHPYGMGPRHGSIIFSIGLKREVRQRESDPPLDEEEINAVVYYLRMLRRIQEARATATI